MVIVISTSLLVHHCAGRLLLVLVLQPDYIVGAGEILVATHDRPPDAVRYATDASYTTVASGASRARKIIFCIYVASATASTTASTACFWRQWSR